MRVVPSEEVVDAYGAQLISEGDRDLRAEGDDDWSIAMYVAQWNQWVKEIEGGGLWFDVEWKAACDLRDDLDASMEALGASEDFMKLVLFVDQIDQRFRGATVSAGKAPARDDAEWWWHRVPRRTDQRLFLGDRWRPVRIGKSEG